MTEREFGDLAQIIVLGIGYGWSYEQTVKEWDLDDTAELRETYPATQKDMAQMKAQGVGVDTMADS